MDLFDFDSLPRSYVQSITTTNQRKLLFINKIRQKPCSHAVKMTKLPEGGYAINKGTEKNK